MKTIKIYGASDDLIEVDGKIKGCDEYGTGGTGPLMGIVKIRGGEHEIHVYCIYAGSWAFAVCPQDGDYDVMPWEMRREFGANSTYSETVEIDVPDDSEVVFT